MFTMCMLSAVVISYALTTPQAFRSYFLQAYTQCVREIRSIFEEKPLSSIMDKERYGRIVEAQRKYLVPLGPRALPYLISLSQEGKWWLVQIRYGIWNGYAGAVPAISKFRPHEIVLSEVPRKVTTEEFPEIIDIHLLNYYKFYLLWWIGGKQRTPQWFAKRYSMWLEARQQGNTQKVQAMYQRLLDIGIAAIPLWLEKLQSERDQSIRREIMKALSYLTDGAVKSNMSPQDCLNWWQANKERWTIPFPKGKREFLKWLESEGWEELRLAIPCVITISRLEDEEAIEALLRFLRHPSSSVREASLERIMILFGEQLPKEYALGVGTDKWERIGDLLEMGKYDWVKKRVAEVTSKMKSDEAANKVGKEISDWWKENKERVRIYWQRAWENVVLW